MRIYLYILLLLSTYSTFSNHIDFGSYLTRNNTKIWYKNSTNASSTNSYCSICCMYINKNTIGKHCGKHTMCIYKRDTVGPACRGFVNIQFTEEEKEALVDAHNTIRNNVALGMESRGDPGPQPKASNMRAVQWDSELEEVAKRWASQCIFGRDICRDVSRYPVGQNIARGNYALTNDLSFIVKWYDNVDFNNPEEVFNYTRESTDSLSLYTQIVWAETYQLGCARVAFQSANGSSVFYKEHFICNYGPTGNIPGQAVYRVGEPCSLCPEGTACTVEYPGLCGNEAVFVINYKKSGKSQEQLSDAATQLGLVYAIPFISFIQFYVILLLY